MKLYEKAKLTIIYFDSEDVIKTSQNDNVVDVPDFPEQFE